MEENTGIEFRDVSQGGRAANQYELPLGCNGLLPLVANLCEKLNDH